MLSLHSSISRRFIAFSIVLSMVLLGAGATALGAVQRAPEHLALLFASDFPGYERLVDKPGEVGYLNRAQIASSLEISDADAERDGLIDGYLGAWANTEGNGFAIILGQFDSANSAAGSLEANKKDPQIESTFPTPQIPNSYGFTLTDDGQKVFGVMFRKANFLLTVVTLGTGASPEKAVSIAQTQLAALSTVPDEDSVAQWNIPYLIGSAVAVLLIVTVVIWGIVKLVRRSSKPAPAFMGYAEPQPFMPANGMPTTSYQPTPAYPTTQFQPALVPQFQPAAVPQQHEPAQQAVEQTQYPAAQPQRQAAVPAAIPAAQPMPVVSQPAAVVDVAQPSKQTVGIGNPVITYPDGWEGPRE